MLKRVLTAIVGIPIVCAAASAANHIPFVVLCTVAIMIACREARDLAKIDLRDRQFAMWTALGGVAVMLAAGGIVLSSLSEPMKGLSLGLIGIGAVAATWFKVNALASWWPFACLAPLMFFQDVPARNGFAFSWPLAVMIPLWVGDSLALFVGKAIGKHPLAPNISPNKTWEGAVGNLIGASAASIAVSQFYSGFPLQPLALAISTGIFGQFGDLFESALKRRANVKDSGNLLPGHGGILDRLDSLCFATASFAVLSWLIHPLP